MAESHASSRDQAAEMEHSARPHHTMSMLTPPRSPKSANAGVAGSNGLLSLAGSSSVPVQRTPRQSIHRAPNVVPPPVHVGSSAFNGPLSASHGPLSGSADYGDRRSLRLRPPRVSQWTANPASTSGDTATPAATTTPSPGSEPPSFDPSELIRQEDLDRVTALLEDVGNLKPGRPPEDARVLSHRLNTHARRISMMLSQRQQGLDNPFMRRGEQVAARLGLFDVCRDELVHFCGRTGSVGGPQLERSVSRLFEVQMQALAEFNSILSKQAETVQEKAKEDAQRVEELEAENVVLLQAATLLERDKLAQGEKIDELQEKVDKMEKMEEELIRVKRRAAANARRLRPGRSLKNVQDAAPPEPNGAEVRSGRFALARQSSKKSLGGTIGDRDPSPVTEPPSVLVEHADGEGEALPSDRASPMAAGGSLSRINSSRSRPITSSRLSLGVKDGPPPPTARRKQPNGTSRPPPSASLQPPQPSAPAPPAPGPLQGPSVAIISGISLPSVNSGGGMNTARSTRGGTRSTPKGSLASIGEGAIVRPQPKKGSKTPGEIAIARAAKAAKAGSVTQELSLRNLKLFIEDVYASKVKFDNKCRQAKLPRETLEQHLHTYLNQKYGLPSIIREWAESIVAAIRRHAPNDNDVAVFLKILRSEVEEDFRHVQRQLKEAVRELLKVQLRSRFPTKAEGVIRSMCEKKIKGDLEEFEWTDIVRYVYNQSDASALEDRVREHIRQDQAQEQVIASQQGGKVKRRVAPPPPRRKLGSVAYEHFLRILLDFQLKNHEKFLLKFRHIFRLFDHDKNGVLSGAEFQDLLLAIDPSKQHSEIRELVMVADPFDTDNITFSECVMVLSTELLRMMDVFAEDEEEEEEAVEEGEEL